MLNGSNEPFFRVVEVLCVICHVLNCLCFGAHGSGAALAGRSIASTSIYPVADGVALASAVGVVVATLPIGRAAVAGIVSKTSRGAHYN